MLEAGKPSLGSPTPSTQVCWLLEGTQSSQVCYYRKGGASGREKSCCLGSQGSHPGLPSPGSDSSPHQRFHPSPHNLKLLLEVHCRKKASCLGKRVHIEACHHSYSSAALWWPQRRHSLLAFSLLSSHRRSRIIRAFSGPAAV